MADKKRLTIPELIERYPREVMTLSPQQRNFVFEYIASGLANGKYDAVAAVRWAYPKVKEARVWANRILLNRRVKHILTLHQGLTEAEVLLADAKSIIKNLRRKDAKPDVFVGALLSLASALRAYVKKESHE